jgi:predicted permease
MGVWFIAAAERTIAMTVFRLDFRAFRFALCFSFFVKTFAFVESHVAGLEEAFWGEVACLLAVWAAHVHYVLFGGLEGGSV